MEKGRPAQKSQPSRKGKKAWRKNIDIDDLHEGLEEARELERTVGTADLGKAESDVLFTVDTAGDEVLKPAKMRGVKLKSDEILAKRSAVPALKAPHKKSDKVQGVSIKEMTKLLKVSGKDGSSSSMARIEHDGITTGQTWDLWGSEPAPDAKPKRPIEDSEYIKSLKPASGFNKMEKAPPTMKHAPHAPVSDAKAVELPAEGRSYNPSIEAWRVLIEKENAKEEEREAQRLRLQQERARIEQVIQNMNGNDLESSSESEGGESEPEEEEDESNDGVKSVNPPVKVKTKSERQRRKQAKHEETVRLQAQMKELKAQIAILENLPKLLEKEKEKLKAAEATETAEKPRKKKVKLSKYKPIPAPLEVKLSDELTDSLRRLKPEGSLVTDRFRSLQERGLVEARIPGKKRRRYRQKAVEKHQFKSIKLKD